MGKILIKQSPVQQFQQVTGPKVSARDLWNRMTYMGGGERPSASLGQRFGAGLGLLGKVGAGLAAGYQAAHGLQGGNVSAPLTVGLNYQGLDPTATSNLGQTKLKNRPQTQSVPLPETESVPLPPPSPTATQPTQQKPPTLGELSQQPQAPPAQPVQQPVQQTQIPATATNNVADALAATVPPNMFSQTEPAPTNPNLITSLMYNQQIPAAPIPAQVAPTPAAPVPAQAPNNSSYTEITPGQPSKSAKEINEMNKAFVSRIFDEFTDVFYKADPHVVGMIIADMYLTR